MINKAKYGLFGLVLALAMIPATVTFAAPHGLGTNINANGTVYTITTENGVTVRRPYTSAGAFLSYSYNHWGSVVAASSEDLALPLGSFIPPQDGKIICSDRGTDKGTCYLITDRKKAAFTSATVFRQFGYNFAYAMHGDVSFLSNADNINQPNVQHPSGTLVNIDGTIYLIAGNVLLGLPSWQTLEGWGYKPSDIIMANAADRLLQKGGAVAPKEPGQISPPVPSGPILMLSTPSVSFRYVKGGSVPSPITVYISNNSSTESLNYTISLPDPPAWLNTTYNTQQLSLGPLQSAGMSISVDPSALDVGTYMTAISFTGNFANSPTKIDVILEVDNAVPTSTVNPQILTVSLPDANVGSEYSYQLTASGGTAPYTWAAPSIVTPSGGQGTNCCVLGVDSNGLFSTQSADEVESPVGIYSWTFEVTDANGKKGTKVLNLTINPEDYTAYFQINTEELPVAMEDGSYSAQISFNYITNGTNYATNATFSGLPPGITTGSASGPNTNVGIVVNNPGSVSLTGKPTVSGSYDVTLTLDDQHGASLTKKFTLTVNHQ